MKLETKRLILRSIEERDRKDLIENISNLNVSRYLLVVPHPYTDADADFWIKHCAEEAGKKPRKSYELAIELKSEGRVIGGVGFTKVDLFQEKAEIGYWLGEKYWRQGIMSEALEKMLDFAFNELNLRRIEAGTFAENLASQRLLEKFGFRKEGIKRQGYRAKATGRIHDDVLYGLLREEYLQK